MPQDQLNQRKAKNPQRDRDWENRVLCSDGNCIGVIGPDGRCKECGKPYEGKLPWQIKSEPTVPDSDAARDENSQPLNEKSAAEAADSTDETSQEENDWENRRLCSDGNCIGVIGPDGLCKECSRPFKGD